MIERWKSLPEWVQRLLYLPSVLVCSASAGLLTSLPILNGQTNKISTLLVSVVAAFIATTVFYWSAFYLAPRWKKIIAGVLYFLLMFLWVATIVRVTYEWNQGSGSLDQKSIIELCQAMVSITWSSFLFISAFRSNVPLQL